MNPVNTVYFHGSTRRSGQSCVQWSADNKVCVVTEATIHVFDLACPVASVQSKNSIPMRLSSIELTKDYKPNKLNVGISEKQISKELKHVKNITKHMSLFQPLSDFLDDYDSKGKIAFKFANWSPEDMADHRQCLLLVSTTTGHLTVWHPVYSTNLMHDRWSEAANLSEILCGKMKEHNFFEKQDIFKNRRKAISEAIEEAIPCMQLRTPIYTKMDEKCPNLVKFRDRYMECQVTNAVWTQAFHDANKGVFSIVIAVSQNGTVIFWKILRQGIVDGVRLVDSGIVGQFEEIGSLAYSEEGNMLALGTVMGRVLTMSLKVSEYDDFLTVSDTTWIVNEYDEIPVNLAFSHMKCSSGEPVLVVCKSNVVQAFQLQDLTSQLSKTALKTFSQNEGVVVKRTSTLETDSELDFNVLSNDATMGRLCGICEGKSEEHFYSEIIVSEASSFHLSIKCNPINLPMKCLSWQHGIAWSQNAIFFAVSQSTEPAVIDKHQAPLKCSLSFSLYLPSDDRAEQVIREISVMQSPRFRQFLDVIVYFRMLAARKTDLANNSAFSALNNLRNGNNPIVSKILRCVLKEKEGQNDDLLRLLETRELLNYCEILLGREHGNHPELNCVKQWVLMKKLGKSANNDLLEKCRVCEEPISLESYRFGCCKNEHQFPRCSQTLQVLQETRWRQCKVCGCVALALSDKRKFLADNCIFCDMPMLAQ